MCGLTWQFVILQELFVLRGDEFYWFLRWQETIRWPIIYHIILQFNFNHLNGLFAIILFIFGRYHCTHLIRRVQGVAIVEDVQGACWLGAHLIKDVVFVCEEVIVSEALRLVALFKLHALLVVEIQCLVLIVIQVVGRDVFIE